MRHSSSILKFSSSYEMKTIRPSYGYNVQSELGSIQHRVYAEGFPKDSKKKMEENKADARYGKNIEDMRGADRTEIGI